MGVQPEPHPQSHLLPTALVVLSVGLIWISMFLWPGLLVLGLGREGGEDLPVVPMCQVSQCHVPSWAHSIPLSLSLGKKDQEVL